jgi:hypothetical protein
LDFFEYAWCTAFQITKKEHDRLKILLSDKFSFPVLGKDEHGYIMYLPEPKIIDNGLISYQGMLFNSEDEEQKEILWRMFKASVYHLSLHVAVSDFEAYADWAKGKNISLATYVVSILEDASVNAYLRAFWPSLIIETAYANAFSYLRLKAVASIVNNAHRVMTSVLLQFTIGMVKETLDEKMKKDVDDVVSLLKEIESLAYKKLLDSKNAGKNKDEDLKSIVNSIAFKKIRFADEIYRKISRYAKACEVPSLPYTDSHGNLSNFYDSSMPSEKDIEKILKNALIRLDSKIKENEIINASAVDRLREEVSQAFSLWDAERAKQEKILQGYRLLGDNTHFVSFEFPEEDYAEYLRRKAILSGPIRRVMNKLRLFQNIYGEDFRQESGNIDLQEAVQVVASKSQRSDIFVREELQTNVEAWAILIDTSRSLRSFTGEVRDIALCLADVANEIILDRTDWGMFAFSNKFYVIKDFSEVYNKRTRSRIGGLRHSGMTYLPDGLKLAAEALKSCREEVRVLVVVSDFFPIGYEDIEKDLINAVRKVERLGVGVIGIGVDSRAVRDYLRINCVVEDPYELMKKFCKAFFEYTSML